MGGDGGMGGTGPLLSVVVVLGPLRRRAQRLVDAVAAQTVAPLLELVLVDLASPGAPGLDIPPNLRTVQVRDATGWTSARAAGVRHASAPIVAFLEDHCYPAPTWAEALMRAHQESWAAVGYGFTNANPETYFLRASMVNDYGTWHHPVLRGETTALPASNVSYKRDFLLSFGDELDALLTPDFNIQEELKSRGLRMFVEPDALAAHENIPDLSFFARAHFSFSRLMGARRARARRWGLLPRVVYGLLTPAASPAISTFRLFRSLRGREALWPAVLASMPVYLIAHQVAAIGEGWGYLFGEGNGDRAVEHLELNVTRTT